LFLGCGIAKNRTNKGLFWCRNPFNVLLKIALPDVDRISTVFLLRWPRKAAKDEEPKNKRREYASKTWWKTGVLIMIVINAGEYFFVFRVLFGSED